MKTKICSIFGLAAFVIAPFAWADDESGGGTQQPSIPRPDPHVAEFARGVKFTVNGYQGGTEVQTNFPVLVRLSAAITGFDYGDFYNDGSLDTDGDGQPNLELIDIGFVDAEGHGLAYDIDTWNTNGESLVWVNLPIMTNNTEFAMWYRSSKTGKALNPDNVWTNYAGVWHFREDYGAETGSVKVYDSTTNQLTGSTLYNATTKGTSVSGGKVGRGRRMGDNIADGNKGTGGIDVSLDEQNSPKRAAVDRLASPTPVFSTSFWIYPERTVRYPYYISRKNADTYPAWAIQSNDNKANTANAFRIFSCGDASNKNLGISNVGAAQNTWTKIDVVYTDEGSSGKGYFYVNGVLKNNGGGNLNSGKAANGSVDLYIGGGSGNDCRPFGGIMDEVRLQYGRPTAARIKADFDTVNNASFLTNGTVVTEQIIERPVVNFTVADIGASHIQFGGNLSSLGSDQATECTFYAKVWPTTADTEPSTWSALGTGLGTGALSGLVKGLTPGTAYSYRLKVTNNEGDEGVDSYETADDFMTSGVGVSGTGGDVTRVDDDWIHYFRVGTDDESGDTVNTYTFTPPSYATTVRALVVAGGGPGGYKAGGGGGAGGLIYSNALAVTFGNTYTITVGEGGAASTSITEFGKQGGSSSISNGVTEVVRAIGGGAGGNFHDNNANWRIGQDGGSGGGSPHSGSKAGAGTAGQGNVGGKGNGDGLAGGGGGAFAVGGSAIDSGDFRNAGSGGGGFECDISGVATFYAGGGGGGGRQVADKPGTAGVGGNGGGGIGSRRDVNGTASAATAGVDGLGGGGGGGCGDVEALYQGGDGGDGIVIIRYASQGDYTAIAEPIISLQSAVCNDAAFTGDVAFRVAWAGYGHDDVAQVKAVWGYAKTALTHTNVIATAAIGLGTGSFPLKADKRTVYLKLLAVNAAGKEAYSSEMISFYVNENTQAVEEEDDLPILENIALEADAAWATVSGEVISAGRASGSPKTCTVRVKYGTTAAALTTVVATNNVAVGDVMVAVNGLLPNTTYYYAVEIEDDAGTVITEDTASFTTLPQPTFAAVATEVNATTLSLSGGLSVAGGGITTVFVAWGDAAPVVVATFTKDSETMSFACTNTLPAWAESVEWKVVYSNELTNADGTGNGTVKTTESNGTLNPVDTATYTWQAVEDEWSGNWTNTAHWVSDKAVCRGYPNGANTAASFANCTTQNPAVVTIDGKYSVGAFVPNAVNGASDITFRGAGRASSGITATSPVLWSDAKHVCSDTQIKFEEMAVTFNNDWQIMRHAQDAGGPVAYSNILVRFSNVGLNVNNKQLKLCAPYSRLEFTDGTTATAGEVTVSGTDSVLLVDDSAVTANTNLRLGVQCLPNEGEHILFRGAAPKLTAKSWFSPYKITNQPVGVVFEVPVGGYASTPFVFSHTSNTFGQPDGDGSTGKVGMYTFAVSPDSPALKVNATIENNVLVQTTAGFYSTVLSDSVFTVPERDGSPTGAFKWGVEGEPLEGESPDLTTARQILLDLQGKSNGIMFLIY